MHVAEHCAARVFAALEKADFAVELRKRLHEIADESGVALAEIERRLRRLAA